jgi:hypothetical protein
VPAAFPHRTALAGGESFAVVALLADEELPPALPAIVGLLVDVSLGVDLLEGAMGSFGEDLVPGGVPVQAIEDDQVMVLEELLEGSIVAVKFIVALELGKIGQRFEVLEVVLLRVFCRKLVLPALKLQLSPALGRNQSLQAAAPLRWRGEAVLAGLREALLQPLQRLSLPLVVAAAAVLLVGGHARVEGRCDLQLMRVGRGRKHVAFEARGQLLAEDSGL